MTRRRALAAIALVMLAIFVAGFGAAWVKARDDKSSCRRLPQPSGAASVRVQHRPDDTRACVWLDRNGATVGTRKLP
jgi:hypothetical protein